MGNCCGGGSSVGDFPMPGVGTKHGNSQVLDER